MNKSALSLVLILIILGFFTYIRIFGNPTKKINQEENEGGPKQELHPLSIEAMRKGNFPGSDLVIEQTLDPGSSYSRFIASFKSSLSANADKSEELKIYGLLTVPNGEKPKNGWPVIIFNHGFIPPDQYKTTERYIAYTDAFSRSGYIVFKPDYRGHGNSEGEAIGGYGSNGYTVDVLNALASLKKFKDADPNRIGMWGHSMGGFLTLRSMVVSKDVKVGVIWAGVVASYPDLIKNWRRGSFTPPPQLSGRSRRWRQLLIDQYGTPAQNPKFWNSLSANSYLADISGPIQLHHSTTDEEVPVEFSQKLYDQMKKEGKEVELYTYPGDDHNISANLGTALQRSVEFFDKYLK